MTDHERRAELLKEFISEARESLEMMRLIQDNRILVSGITHIPEGQLESMRLSLYDRIGSIRELIAEAKLRRFDV